jgi:ribosomal protein S19E (S16A)
MVAKPDAALERVRAAKPLAEKLLRELLGEVAIGITRVGGVYGFKVNVAAPPDPATQVPSRVADIPVRLEVTGPIKKRPKAKRP